MECYDPCSSHGRHKRRLREYTTQNKITVHRKKSKNKHQFSQRSRLGQNLFFKERLISNSGVIKVVHYDDENNQRSHPITIKRLGAVRFCNISLTFIHSADWR